MTKYMERNKILVVDDEEDLCEIFNSIWKVKVLQ